MLSAGYAVTYEQSGGEYGPWGKDKFLQYEEVARSVSLIAFGHSSDCSVNLNMTPIFLQGYEKGDVGFQ
jgi:hypothetical protein